jgi:microcystin-dependent protein
MSEPFIAEVKIFAGNFAPRSWAFCDGQLLPIAQNTALFSLVGTFYGGDGRTTLGLPNLQGRAAMHPGRGPGLTPRTLAQRSGTETVTLSQAQMPAHTHTMTASNETDDPLPTPVGNTPARSSGPYVYRQTSSNLVNLAPQAVPNVGGNQAHNNIQPSLVLNFIIALQGTYPSRS